MSYEYAIFFQNMIHKDLRPLVAASMECNSRGADHFRDKMQLRTLYFNLINLCNEIAKEEVVCRYKKARTPRHVRLCTEAEEAFENLRQLAVQFNLSH